MPQGKTGDAKRSNGANLGFEEKLWQAADKLRGHMDAAEYKAEEVGFEPTRAVHPTRFPVVLTRPL